MENIKDYIYIPLVVRLVNKVGVVEQQHINHSGLANIKWKSSLRGFVNVTPIFSIIVEVSENLEAEFVLTMNDRCKKIFFHEGDRISTESSQYIMRIVETMIPESMPLLNSVITQEEIPFHIDRTTQIWMKVGENGIEYSAYRRGN